MNALRGSCSSGAFLLGEDVEAGRLQLGEELGRVAATIEGDRRSYTAANEGPDLRGRASQLASEAGARLRAPENTPSPFASQIQVSSSAAWAIRARARWAFCSRERPKEART